MERGDGAVFLHAGLHPHQCRMPAPVAVEDLFAREADLDRAARHAREMGHDDLVIEGVRLAAEPAAVGRRNHADLRGRHDEDPGERAVHVVRRLRRRPESQLPVRAEIGERRVLLEGQVRAALVEVQVVVNAVGAREALCRVAELHRDELVDVAGVAVVVDRRRRGREAVLDRADRRQRFVPNIDEVERVEGGVLADGRDRGDRVAHEANAIRAERVLVLRHRQNAERNRKVPSGGDGDDARGGQRPRDVDREDAGVGDLRAQELAMEHPGQHDVVGEFRLPRHLRRGVHLGVGASDDAGLLQGLPLPAGEGY